MKTMIERAIGVLLRPIRGHDAQLLCRDPRLAGVLTAMVLTSPAFAEGESIPRRHAGLGAGQNLSPPLQWRGVPPETVGLVLVMQDPDAPLPRPVTHLVAIDIPVDSDGVAEGRLAPEANAAIVFHRGSFGRIGYAGPRPVRGHGEHRYVFQLFALARPLPAVDIADVEALARVMAGRVLTSATLTGTYRRR